MGIEEIVVECERLAPAEAAQRLESVAREYQAAGVADIDLAPVYHSLALNLMKASDASRACAWMGRRLNVTVDGESTEWLRRQYSEMLAAAGRRDEAVEQALLALDKARQRGNFVGLYYQYVSSTLWACEKGLAAIAVAREWLAYESGGDGSGLAAAARLRIAAWCTAIGAVDEAREELSILLQDSNPDVVRAAREIGGV